MSPAISIFVLAGHVNIFGVLPNYTLPNTPKSIETSTIIPQPLIPSNQSSVPSPVGALPNDTLPTELSPIETSSITPQPLIQPTPVPVGETRRLGYTYTPGIGAHRFYDGPYNWTDAWTYCNDRGAHLTVINSDAEMEIIKQFLNETTKKQESWIGAHDLYKEGKFVTIHGESLEKAGFNSWQLGEPNASSGNENCVMLNSAGKLNDLSCADERHFTCELAVSS